MVIGFSILRSQAVTERIAEVTLFRHVCGLSADEKETPGDWRASRMSTPRAYADARASLNPAAHQARHQDSKARSSLKKIAF